MIDIRIDNTILEPIPTFKVGALQYYHIVVGDSPQMLKGRLQFFQETLLVDLETKELQDFDGILEWRDVFKTLKSNPKRYPPSQEALYTRIKKKGTLPPVHSAVDLNNFFSLQYEIPLGIYDTAHLNGNITVRLGTEHDCYEGLNGRMNTMANKIISADETGAFGSPFVDSLRTRVTETTTSALHLIYLRPSTDVNEGTKMIEAIGSMFTQIHGGHFESAIITAP